MGETTGISWCDHTASRSVNLSVADIANSYSIVSNKAQFWMIGKRFQMMGMKVSTAKVSTHLTSKAISKEDIITPALVFGRKSNTPTLSHVSIFIGMASFTFGGSFSENCADLFSRLWRVLEASAVASASLGRITHFTSRFLTVAFSLKWGDEGDATNFPLLSDLRFCFFGVGHSPV